MLRFNQVRTDRTMSQQQRDDKTYRNHTYSTYRVNSEAVGTLNDVIFPSWSKFNRQSTEIPACRTNDVHLFRWHNSAVGQCLFFLIVTGVGGHVIKMIYSELSFSQCKNLQRIFFQEQKSDIWAKYGLTMLLHCVLFFCR